MPIGECPSWRQWRRRQTVATGLLGCLLAVRSSTIAAVWQMQPSYVTISNLCNFRFVSVFYHIQPFSDHSGFVSSALLLAFHIRPLQKIYFVRRYFSLVCSRFYIGMSL
jgi:hypothetical protein